MKTTNSMKNENFVSVIIPVLNAEKYIKFCLQSFSSISYAKDRMEIIVVDGGSKDATVEIIKVFDVKLLSKQGASIAQLRNCGAEAATGGILSFIDSDCVASPDWLTRGVAVLNSGDDVGATGAEYKLPDKASWVEAVWDLQVETRRRSGTVDWLPSGNLIVKSNAFKEIGGFREDLVTSEDVDFCQRLINSGYKIISDPSVAVVHFGNPKSVKEFIKKEVWRGTGAVQKFLYSFPKLKFTKSVSFAIFNLICIFSLTLGTILVMFGKNWVVFLSSILVIIALPFLLALNTLSKQKKWKYFFPLSFLYFSYGIARAACFFKHKNINCLKTSPATPILLYHDICCHNSSAGTLEAEKIPYILHESDFEKQMRYLREEGYEAIGISDFYNKSASAKNEGKDIIISFDDGLSSNYEKALPVLRKYGLKAIFFITAGKVGQGDMMNWAEIKELSDSGMEIGSHSLTHAIPTNLTEKELETELKESKRILEEKLNIKIDYYSSPTGYYNPALPQMAEKAGYKAVLISRADLNRRPGSFILNKISIKRGYDFEKFTSIVKRDAVTFRSLRMRQDVRNRLKNIFGHQKYDLVRSAVLGGAK